MTYVEQLKARNLFYAEPAGPKDQQDINRFISVYGGSKEVIDFIGDSRRTLELLWELVTAHCGAVTFEYTIGACIVSAPRKGFRVTGSTIGWALAELFIEVMKREAETEKL